MDYIRSCYETDMRLSADVSAPPVRVRWHFCASNAKLFGNRTSFRSLNNTASSVPLGGVLGEVEGAERKYVKGIMPPGRTGQRFCGPLDWWRDGVPNTFPARLDSQGGSVESGVTLFARAGELVNNGGVRENGAAAFLWGGGIENDGGSLSDGASGFAPSGGFANDGGALENGAAAFAAGSTLVNLGGALENGVTLFAGISPFVNLGGALENGTGNLRAGQRLVNAGGSKENGAATFHPNLAPQFVATLADPSTCGFGGRVFAASAGSGTQAGSTSSTTFTSVAQWVGPATMRAGAFFASLNITALSANAEIRFNVRGANGTTCAIPDASGQSATYAATGIFQEFLTMAHTSGVDNLLFNLEMRRASGAGSVSVTITRGASSFVRPAG